MPSYLLIESRDPFESHDVSDDYDLARRLAERGDRVAVFLVQNGVLPTRAGTRSAAFEALLASGASVLADDFSLRERGIAARELREGVRPAPIDECVDRLAAGHRVVWL